MRLFRRAARESDAERRLSRGLAEAGLLSRRGGRAPVVAGAGARLREVLEALGPVAAAFARHLSTRADLLALADCSELAHAALPVAPLSAERVRARVAAELGPAAPSLGDDSLQHAGVFHERHAARLADSTAVVLVLRRPEWDAPPDTAWLRGVAAAVPGAEAAAEEFAEALARRCDLAREARGLDRLRERARASETFVVPRVFTDLSSPRLLVQAALDGRPVDAAARGDARRWCAAFFHAALLDGLLLEEPAAADFRLLPGERVAVVGGPLRELDEGERRLLLAYVSAVARDDPDAACAALVRLGRAAPDGIDRDELRLRLRQAEPLRAGLGFERYQGRRLAHSLGVQWRVARECGCLSRPALGAFARAALALDRAAAARVPAHDAPAEGLADVRQVAAVVELRELLAPSRVTANLARFLPPLVELVQRADRAALDVRRDDHGVPAGAGWGAFWARVALVAAAALVAPRLLAVLGQPWDERVAAFVLLGAGALLLGFVRRGERAGAARTGRSR